MTGNIDRLIITLLEESILPKEELITLTKIINNYKGKNNFQVLEIKDHDN